MKFKRPRDRLQLMAEFKELLDQSLKPPTHKSDDETSEEANQLTKKKTMKRASTRAVDTIASTNNAELSKEEILQMRITQQKRALATFPGQSFIDPTWDLDEEFLNVYAQLPIEIPSFKLPSETAPKKRKSVYQFLNDLDSKEAHAKAYEAIIDNFLCAGFRVEDIESSTLRQLQAFGSKNAFFEEDELILTDFCEAILLLNFRFAVRYADDDIKKTLCGGKKENHKKFDQLVKLLSKVLKKMNKKKYEKLVIKFDFEKEAHIEKESKAAAEAEELRILNAKRLEDARLKRRAEIAKRLAWEREHPEEAKANRAKLAANRVTLKPLATSAAGSQSNNTVSRRKE